MGDHHQQYLKQKSSSLWSPPENDFHPFLITSVPCNCVEVKMSDEDSYSEGVTPRRLSEVSIPHTAKKRTGFYPQLSTVSGANNPVLR